MSDFKVITYRRKKRNQIEGNKLKKFSPESQSASYISKGEITKKIQVAQEEIKDSSFYQSFVQSLDQGNCNLQNIDIVCYGLGQFSQCVSSRYQFAFLLLLKDYYKAKVFLFDPIFIPDEIFVLNDFGCLIIDSNEEGKRQVHHNTLFFLPHCPKQLINNLLWKNWNKTLSKCIVISNSFEKIVESHSDRFLKENLQYVFCASSFVTELKIDNSFKFSDIFNDLSIHFFLEQDILNLSCEITNLNKEPVYQEEDIEFVTRILHNNLDITK